MIATQTHTGTVQTGSEPPLIMPSNLTHLGTFLFPGGGSSGATFDSSAAVGAYNPANNSLFMVGHINGWNKVCEVAIPPLGGTASIIQDWVDIPARFPLRPPVENTQHIGGMLVRNGKLVGTLYEFYDAASPLNSVSHWRLEGLDLANSPMTGMFNVANGQAGRVAGYICEVPAGYQAQFGKPLLSGLCGIPNSNRTSQGPAAYVFDDDEFSADTPTTEVLGYTLTDPLADGWNDMWNNASEVRGACFLPGFRTVMFWGTHGTGEPWYGDGDPARDPNRLDKGYHAWPYRDQIWLYDANDLLAVKAGTLLPWQVQPYTTWFDLLPTAETDPRIGSVTFDAASGKLYVIQRKGDTWDKPLAHVYQVS